jgi:hypothetical protein
VTLDRRWVRVTIAVAFAAVAAVVAWLLVRHFDGRSTKSHATSSTTDVSAVNLRSLAIALGRPVYWVGPRKGVTYEFTETADRRIYVRYLPKGVAAGSPKPFLTVASYPVENAFAVTTRAANGGGTVKLDTGGGGVAFYNSARPTNAYVAFPGSNVQIEIFDPSGRLARRLVSAGRVRQITASSSGWAVQTQASHTTPADLRRLSSSLQRPIYWLGRIPGTTLELSRSPDGRVYLRYLPAGVAPGSPRGYLTVASYPLATGFIDTKDAAGDPDTVKIPLPNGAVAFYARARPTNVYVAFPGVPEQVEVFDPSAGRVHALIAADRIEPVS